jgi:hypothetical protein
MASLKLNVLVKAVDVFLLEAEFQQAEDWDDAVSLPRRFNSDRHEGGQWGSLDQLSLTGGIDSDLMCQWGCSFRRCNGFTPCDDGFRLQCLYSWGCWTLLPSSRGVFSYLNYAYWSSYCAEAVSRTSTLGWFLDDGSNTHHSPGITTKGQRTTGGMSQFPVQKQFKKYYKKACSYTPNKCKQVYRSLLRAAACVRQYSRDLLE